MKKFALLSLVASCSLFGLTNDEIKSIYTSSLMPGTGVEIIEREALKEVAGVDKVVIEISSHGNSQRSVIFIKDNYIIPDLLDTKTGKSFAAEFSYKEQQRLALESFDNIVFSDKKDIDGIKGVKSAMISTKEGNVSSGDIVLMSGDYLVRDLIDPKTGKSFLGEYLLKKSNEKIAKIYKDEKYIIKVGKGDKNATTVLFVDPMSAHSKDTVAALDRLLEKYNVEVVSLSLVGGDASIALNADMYKEIKATRDNSKNLDILKKYYGGEVNATKPSKDSKEDMADLTSRYIKAGVNSVPRVVNKADLK